MDKQTARQIGWWTNVKIEKHVVNCTSNTNIRTVRLCVRFLLSPFPIVSVAVWITDFARFDRCLNLAISIDYKTLGN